MDADELAAAEVAAIAALGALDVGRDLADSLSSSDDGDDDDEGADKQDDLSVPHEWEASPAVPRASIDDVDGEAQPVPGEPLSADAFTDDDFTHEHSVHAGAAGAGEARSSGDEGGEFEAAVGGASSSGEDDGDTLRYLDDSEVEPPSGPPPPSSPPSLSPSEDDDDGDEGDDVFPPGEPPPPESLPSVSDDDDALPAHRRRDDSVAAPSSPPPPESSPSLPDDDGDDDVGARPLRAADSPDPGDDAPPPREAPPPNTPPSPPSSSVDDDEDDNDDVAPPASSPPGAPAPQTAAAVLSTSTTTEEDSSALLFGAAALGAAAVLESSGLSTLPSPPPPRREASRYDLHVHEEAMVMVNRAGSVDRCKIRGKFFVASPESSLGPLEMQVDVAQVLSLSLAPATGVSASADGAVLSLTLPKDAPRSPPTLMATYTVASAKGAKLPLKVSAALKYQGGTAYVVVYAIANPALGATEVIELALAVAVGEALDGGPAAVEGVRSDPPAAWDDGVLTWKLKSMPVGVKMVLQARLDLAGGGGGGGARASAAAAAADRPLPCQARFVVKGATMSEALLRSAYRANDRLAKRCTFTLFFAVDA